jgi:hypothetical protein
MKITRRSLAAAVVASAGRGQAPPKDAPPAEELAAARKRLRESLDTLRKLEVEMTVEPDFTFKA